MNKVLPIYGRKPLMSRSLQRRIERYFQKLTDIMQKGYIAFLNEYKPTWTIATMSSDVARGLSTLLYRTDLIKEHPSFHALIGIADRMLNNPDEMHDCCHLPLLDYVAFAITGTTPAQNHNNWFNSKSLRDAAKILAEDLETTIPPHNVIATISGLSLKENIMNLTESLRFRRATRFEIRKWSVTHSFTGSAPIDDPHESPEESLMFHIQPIYLVEYSSDYIFDVCSDFLLHIDKSVKKNKDTEMTILTDTMKISSYSDAKLMIAHLVSCFRILWNCGVGINELIVNSRYVIGTKTSSAVFMWTGFNKDSIIPETSPANHSWRERNELSLGDDELAKLRRFWAEFGNSAKNKRYLRAVRRFNNAVISSDPEDEIVDLIISLETLFKATSFKMVFLASYLLGIDAKSRANAMASINSAYRKRSAIVHGGSLEKDKKWEKVLAELIPFTSRALLFSAVLLSNNARAIDEIVQEAALDPIKLEELHSRLVEWSNDSWEL